jgi:hypothetical protein
MEKLELSEAVDAYLAHTANSWQKFIVEDYYECFGYGFDILDLFQESKIKEIKDRIYGAILKKINDMEK